MTIKLLVADDSALMRRHLKELFEAEGGFEVRTVRNGAEALAELERFDPDVITLDINMPEMDGLTCLSRIMVQRPKPVVMVSSLTAEGAEATLQSLSLGAVDFVRKPDGTISLSIDRICARAARQGARGRGRAGAPHRRAARAAGRRARPHRRAAPAAVPARCPGWRAGSRAWCWSACRPAGRARWRKSCRACRPGSPGPC